MRVYHVGIVKPLLLQLLRTHGARAIMTNWTGDDAAAIAVVERDPRDVFVFDVTCTRQGPDGACLGHSTSEVDRA